MHIKDESFNKCCFFFLSLEWPVAFCRFEFISELFLSTAEADEDRGLATTEA